MAHPHGPGQGGRFDPLQQQFQRGGLQGIQSLLSQFGRGQPGGGFQPGMGMFGGGGFQSQFGGGGPPRSQLFQQGGGFQSQFGQQFNPFMSMFAQQRQQRPQRPFDLGVGGGFFGGQFGGGFPGGGGGSSPGFDIGPNR